MSPAHQRAEHLPASLEALDRLAGFDAVCCLLTTEERPFGGALGLLDWRLCGALSRVVKSGFFGCAPGEKLLVPADGRVPAERIFVVGLGRLGTVTPVGLEHALAQAAAMLERAGVHAVALGFPALPPELDGVRDELLTRAFLPAFKGRVGVFEA